MSVPKSRYSKEEFARRSDGIYDRDIRPRVGPNDEGKFVVIDIETGAYEIDHDELAASDRLLAHRLDAQSGRGASVPGMPADLVFAIGRVGLSTVKTRSCIELEVVKRKGERQLPKQ